MKNQPSNLVEDDDYLNQLELQHFVDLFKDDGCTNIVDQLKVVSLFPSFVKEEERGFFFSEVTLSEVEEVLKGFKKDKSADPDGWPVDLFLCFFDLVGPDLLRVVEQSRLEGKVSHSLNATFITLISKCENHLTFADFIPISLCNMVYKTISKIATTRLKPFLEKAISSQQYEFLDTSLSLL